MYVILYIIVWQIYINLCPICINLCQIYKVWLYWLFHILLSAVNISLPCSEDILNISILGTIDLNAQATDIVRESNGDVLLSLLPVCLFVCFSGVGLCCGVKSRG